MCAHYEIKTKPQALAEALGLEVDTDIELRTLAKPTDILPIVTETDAHILTFARWGLVPTWAKDIKMGSKMFNARAETLREKPSFAPLLAQQRCLVPATSFTEWITVQGKKQPLVIAPVGSSLFTMAGLFSLWRNPETGVLMPTYTVITTEASQQMEGIHYRMPVILSEAERKLWLSTSTLPQEVDAYLNAYKAPELTITPTPIIPRSGASQLSLF
jgi:putative SOS response-associated peptidase YedK